MYLEHFRLEAFPFTTTPDPRFFYASAKHREALACLLHAVEQRKGFALVTGEVGAGKSTLCRIALERFGDGVASALLVHTSLAPKEFFQAVCAEFSLEAVGKSKFELIQEIKGFILQRREQGLNVVLIVDEAQNLTREVLEEVRLLGNLESATEKLLQIILVGQPELRRLIAAPELRQLNQRISIKFHLGNLSEKDVLAYIDHRLKVAGARENGLFDSGAKEEIFRATHGTPRLVNIICDQALLQAFVDDQPSVDRQTISRVMADREGYYMDAPTKMQSPGLRAH